VLSATRGSPRVLSSLVSPRVEVEPFLRAGPLGIALHTLPNRNSSAK
jgi:hypothetical protein